MNLFGYAVGVQEIVLVMTYIQGKNLDDLLFGKDKILSKVCYYNGLLSLACFFQGTEEQHQYIAVKIASGVQFMHSQDPVIIHQDIKPLNIMVCLVSLAV